MFCGLGEGLQPCPTEGFCGGVLQDYGVSELILQAIWYLYKQELHPYLAQNQACLQCVLDTNSACDFHGQDQKTYSGRGGCLVLEPQDFLLADDVVLLVNFDWV